MFDWRSKQNRDGGWAYNNGDSWTEPTVFALLAQTATQIDRAAFAGGLKFLTSTQRPDGGWSPQPEVAESTWVTALVALLPEEAIGADTMNNGLAWLKGQTGQESTWSFRLHQMITGDKQKYPDGWPWFPGAAAWVIPTSLGILAFERALKRNNDRKLRSRIDAGREFLLTHMCADGGWNHGGNHALGRDGDSYPETTGIALTALRARFDKAALEKAKTAARRHFANCRTAEGIAWLRMGLAAQGEFLSPHSEPVARTLLDVALTNLANSDPSKNPLLS
jgi:squalene cyclase